MAIEHDERKEKQSQSLDISTSTSSDKPNDTGDKNAELMKEVDLPKIDRAEEQRRNSELRNA